MSWKYIMVAGAVVGLAAPAACTTTNIDSDGTGGNATTTATGGTTSVGGGAGVGGGGTGGAGSCIDCATWATACDDGTDECDADLLCGEAEPFHRLGVVLRDAPTKIVHEAECELGDGKALLGHWSPLPQRRRVVASLISASAVLKRPSNCCARQHHGEN